ncbi:MAG: hypothetical protein DRN05_06085 [Thermoplasmata archaeon]|nr:membrane protein insertase YidC [Deltaproteobacteria bacterium]RLF27116.1 MAG: hypothetical protein DRN05_06085 [Thermoplasmata archaeon]
MENRSLIAILIAFLVIVLYQTLFYKPPQKVTKPKEKEKVTKEVTPPHVVPQPKVAEAKKKILPSKEEKEKFVVVETDKYKAKFTTKGARLKEFLLFDYKTRIEENKIVKKIKSIFGIKPKKKEPIDFVNIVEKNISGLPLATSLNGNNIILPEDLNYNVDKETITIRKGEQRKSITFSWENDAIKIIKRFSFIPGNYVVNMDLVIENKEDQPFKGTTSLSWYGITKKKKRYYSFWGPKLMINKRVVKIQGKDLKKVNEKKFSGKLSWVGHEMDYFVALVLPKKKIGSLVEIKNLHDIGENEKSIKTAIYNNISIPANSQIKNEYKLFLGPKMLSLIESLGKDAKKSIDFGWFSIIAVPLLKLLVFFNKYTHNYGLAIILLTILVKIIFTPLSQKSYKSMREMQKLQPEMTMLREKYKNDKARLNKEIMDLYKRRKVNPAGGCLPMILQIPVFFALYRALLGSVELRHAPFFLWINDLSAKDPLFITPIIMGLTMVIQQKMTPSAGDPRQAKMMLFMPIIFTFLFLNFPSGLVLYWLVNNLLSIGEQYLIKKRAT